MSTRVSLGFLWRKAPGSALSVTYKGGDQQSNKPPQSVWTFPAFSIGTADPTRFIFLSYFAKNAGGTDIALNDLTIGGVSATILGKAGVMVAPNTNNASSGMAWAYVPAGTTADIVFNYASNFQQSVGAGIGIDVYSVLGYPYLTPIFSDTTSTTPNKTDTFTIPPGGFALANGASANVTATFSGTMTADNNGTAYTSGLPRWTASQVNASNTAELAGQTATYTNFASSAQPYPAMCRVFGRCG